MRSGFLTFFIGFFCVFNCFAQSKKTILKGSLVMQTGETFSYELILTDSGNVVKGYSYTYDDPNDTKATVRGTIDRQMKTLAFKEKEIVFSHNTRTKAFMCLVNASLEYVHEGTGYVLKGPVTSREADNTSCTPGYIIFNNEKELQSLFSYHEQFDTVISMKKKTTEPVAEAKTPEPEPAVTDKVTKGEERSYEWHTDTVVVDVWDGGNVDGDRVTLELNGKKYLTNYPLVKEKRQVRIPIQGNGVNTLTILAENEGSDPPNTASMMLTDGTLHYSILAYNKKGDAALIKIKKVGRR
jgi:hypothetical protein